MRLGKRNLPEPDMVLAPGRNADFRPLPPSASDVPLILEVCHRTHRVNIPRKGRTN